MGHHRWLWRRHPYRLQRFNNVFDGQPKETSEPPIMTGNEVVIRGMEYQWWIRQGNQPGSANDPSKVYGVKQQSILYDLPYFKVRINYVDRPSKSSSNCV
jgi:hypothetical protein